MVKMNHTHNADQIKDASALPERKRAWLRNHTHTADQIKGTPTNFRERAQGRQHWHDTSQVT